MLGSRGGAVDGFEPLLDQLDADAETDFSLGIIDEAEAEPADSPEGPLQRGQPGAGTSSGTLGE